jgi:hypothetical protein
VPLIPRIKIEVADGGNLFFRLKYELPLTTQVMVVTLENGEFIKVGLFTGSKQMSAL